MEGNDVGRLIARLAVAVVAADGRIATAELVALKRLDGLGLGPLANAARLETERAIHEAVDVRATCAALLPLREDAAILLLTVLAEIAASDRLLAPGEREVFNTVAEHLGVDAAVAARILEAATWPAPDAAGEPKPLSPPARDETVAQRDPNHQRAFRVLGLEPGASRLRIDASYLQLVQRYDPARVGGLGPEFAALAVRRLATITDAYEAALGSLQASA